jgi:hypothetical protein
VRDGRIVDLPTSEREFSGRRVREARFELFENDCLVMISDGYEHAGVGHTRPMGWGHERIAADVARLVGERADAHHVANSLQRTCLDLYEGAPGDDATIVVMRVRPARTVAIWTGPPADRSLDEEAVSKLMSHRGTRVICGGTTAQIAARILDKELVVDWVPPSKSPQEPPTRKKVTPPMAQLEGLDLVTEGIITLGQTVELLEHARTARDLPPDDDASTRLARLLLESDDIHLIVGTALHPTQIADLVRREPMRHVYVRELLRELQRRNKNVTVEYLEIGMNTESMIRSRTAWHRAARLTLGIALALCIPLLGLPQAITGTLVNALLFTAVATMGTGQAMMLGMITPLSAALRGVLPLPLALMIPFIAMGNATLAGIYGALRARHRGAAVVIAAVTKFALLYAAVTLLIPCGR